MSKEKQISEMTKDICEMQYKGMKCAICDTGCDCRMFAEALYNAGYRKQSEGEWIPYESESYGGNDETTWYKCSNCGKDAYGRCWDDEWYSMPICSEYCPNCGAKMKGGAE